MLKFIFGCKSIERILFFLLVNEKCYAHQLHRTLCIPLTPIQKALTRLEEGEILISSVEGKIKTFQFNSQYPLLNELEMLLKRAFHLLEPHEKKQYYYLKPSKPNESKQDFELLQDIWDQLVNISSVTLIAKSHSKSIVQWCRKGKGKVMVKNEASQLTFYEAGSWYGDSEQLQNYSNCFRWTLNHHEKMISLEHLRLGEQKPVFLFHLIPMKTNSLESLNPHLCGEDSYFGWVHYNPLFIQLNFKTIGPKKNEEVEYIYT